MQPNNRKLSLRTDDDKRDRQDQRDRLVIEKVKETNWQIDK